MGSSWVAARYSVHTLLYSALLEWFLFYYCLTWSWRRQRCLETQNLALSKWYSADLATGSRSRCQRVAEKVNVSEPNGCCMTGTNDQANDKFAALVQEQYGIRGHNDDPRWPKGSYVKMTNQCYWPCRQKTSQNSVDSTSTSCSCSVVCGWSKLSEALKQS